MNGHELYQLRRREALEAKAGYALVLRLRWQYGPEEAARKLEGLCPETNRDLEAWRSITAKGQRLP